MRTILVTGGAGFVGANLTRALLARGDQVILFDNLSRAGTGRNLAWLRRAGGCLRVVRGDLRRFDSIRRAVPCAPARGLDAVYHLAAQVAVTTSVADPREDFETNALGTFNLLEAVRLSGHQPAVIYSSTNKVFGAMPDLRVRAGPTRYALVNYPRGIPETYPLDFHSPYGCSKGCADQYVLDYGRTYGIPTAVFRQSCIYGDRQFGKEDQGWLAWIAACALGGRPVTVYGDGKQVRDVLYVDDLVAAFLAATEGIHERPAQAYNIGGGPAHTLSILELLALLERRLGRPVKRRFAAWRPGDQRFFCCDIRKARRDFGWRPRVGVEAGVDRLLEWVRGNLDVILQA